jgi:hypothetical protein
MYYCEDDFIYESRWNSTENSNAKFDINLQSQWNSAVENGYFRYRLNIKHSRILPGRYSFLAQVKRQYILLLIFTLTRTHFYIQTSTEHGVRTFVLSEAN